MKVGLIGTGSMGGMLVRAWLRSGTLGVRHLTVANRSPERIARLQEEFPGLGAGSAAEVAARADLLWLCVKPGETAAALAQAQPGLREGQLLVLLSNTVPMASVEAQVPCRVAKVIPTVTQEVLSGAALVMYGSRAIPADREALEELLRKIGRPVEIREEQGRTAADISSCGPAFLAAVCQHMAREAARFRPDLPEETCLTLVAETMLGTAGLLTRGGMSPGELIRRVSVPGGVTAEAMKGLDRDLPGIWAEVFATTDRVEEEKKRKLFPST